MLSSELTEKGRNRAGASQPWGVGRDEQAALSYRDVDILYDAVSQSAARIVAIQGVSFDVKKGSFTSVIGPSGCGKTSLLRLAAGFQEPTAGSVTCNGEGVRGLNHEVGYVTQQTKLYAWMTTRENLEFPLAVRGVAKNERARRSELYLKMMGLSDFGDNYPHQLSGGMQKRASIAQTLIYDPPIILMDEPFAGLDAQTRMDVESDLLRLWTELRPTIVFVTHDLTEAIALSDAVVVMGARPGRLKTIYQVPLARPRDVRAVQADPGFSAAYQHLWDQFRLDGVVPELQTSVPILPATDGRAFRPASPALDGEHSNGRTQVGRAGALRRRLRSPKLGVRVAQVMLLLVILGLWELLSDVGILDPLIFSHPIGVVQELIHMLSGQPVGLVTIYPQIWTTFTEMAVGYAIGGGGAIITAVILARSRFVAQAVEPFMLAWYGIPIITIAPIFVLVLGIGFGSKVGTATFASFFVVFFQTYAGVKSLDEEQFLLARIMGASRLDLMRKVLIPGSLPFVFVGLRMGIPTAMTGAIIGEFIASSQGLGSFILNASSSFNAPATFAALVILVAIVAIGGLLVRLLERVLVRWRPAG